ncbi:Hsp70 family protein [Rhodococcus fascians]|nr:Hsp70 family protein [Rhodococcus fascians]MBY4141332.1 Hsp70 family protein [Rhodococcus fascians]MBY4219939.1 Hsp70 family protein [Rhodococcus fascians]MBY4225036.1 Hsp70 family protein [Rhodococcus fascians]MBY4235159.1 Hsp70 family protein [Rhodococcus fascians]
MRVGVGVSTGSEGVCAALVTVEADGSHAVEYRTVSADRQAKIDVGDLVTSAVELMASLVPGNREPDSIAVTYRTEEHAARIRAALAHTTRDVRLVPESAAASAHLATTGLVDGYDTIALVDLGASGLSVTVARRTDGVVLSYGRTEAIGGVVLDALVKDLVQNMTLDNLRDDIRDDRGIGSARYRAIKELLSHENEARIERYSGVPLTVSRTAFETAASPLFDEAAQFVRSVFDESTHEPEAIVLIGGGAHIPLLAKSLTDTFHARIVRLPEPDAVLAVGAAVVAASVTDNDYPLVSAARRTAGRMGRYSGAIAAAVVAGGLVLAYGLQTMTPADDPSVSPAGSATEPAAAGDAGRPAAEGYSPSDTPTSTRYTADPIGPAATTADSSRPTSRLPASSAPTTTPTLRPAPDLPRIDWPMDPAPESSSPDAGTSVTVEPSTPVSPEPTTTPAPTTSSPVEPTPAPGETPEPTTPSGPIELSPGPTPRPSAGSIPESSEVPTGSITVPTTVVRGSDPTPELTAPPTVWSPPPAVSGQSVEPRTSPDTVAPRTSEPPQDAQPGT